MNPQHRNTKELTRQQRRDRLARRIRNAYLWGAALLVVRFTADDMLPGWLAALLTFLVFACWICGFVMMMGWYIGAFLSNDRTNDWLE